MSYKKMLFVILPLIILPAPTRTMELRTPRLKRKRADTTVSTPSTRSPEKKKPCMRRPKKMCADSLLFPATLPSHITLEDAHGGLYSITSETATYSPYIHTALKYTITNKPIKIFEPEITASSLDRMLRWLTLYVEWKKRNPDCINCLYENIKRVSPHLTSSDIVQDAQTIDFLSLSPLFTLLAARACEIVTSHNSAPVSAVAVYINTLRMLNNPRLSSFITTLRYDYLLSLKHSTPWSIQHTLGTEDISINRAAVSSDATMIALACQDACARLYDAHTGALITRFGYEIESKSDEGSYAFDGITFSPNNTFLATSFSLDTDDYGISMWNVRTGTFLHHLRGHTEFIHAIAFSPDSRFLVSASFDRTARVWDTSTGKCILTLPHPAGVIAATFSPDGTSILTISQNSTAYLWDAANGTLISSLEAHTDLLHAAHFSPDGRFIVTASADTTACIWNAHSGRLCHQLKGHTGPLYAAQFSSDTTRLVTASEDTTARTWNVQTGKLLMVYPHAQPVYTASFSPDATVIVTETVNDTLGLYNACTGVSLPLPDLDMNNADDLPDMLMSAQFLPNSQRILVVSAQSARIFEQPTVEYFMDMLIKNTCTRPETPFLP